MASNQVYTDLTTTNIQLHIPLDQQSQRGQLHNQVLLDLLLQVSTNRKNHRAQYTDFSDIGQFLTHKFYHQVL